MNLGFSFENNEQLEEAIKSELFKYLFENRADYAAFIGGDCLYKCEYKRKLFEDFTNDELEILVPVLITSLEKGNCDRLEIEFTPDKFEVQLLSFEESKVERKRVGIINPAIDKKTAAFEIRKSKDDYESKINGTFLCYKELFHKAEDSSFDREYYIIAYFKDYFMSKTTKEKEFKIKSEKIKSLALSIKELIDFKKV